MKEPSPLLTGEFMARLEGLQIGMRKVLSGRFRGERRSRRRGRSVEFADHREYVYGDDIRFLDWHLMGRLDRLFVKLYHDEEELRLTVLVDGSASMGFGRPAKIELARKVAAALGYVALASMSRVKVVALEEEGPRELPWQRGLPAAGRLFRFLEEIPAAGRNALVPGLRRWLAEARPSGVAVLVSDLLLREGPRPLLRLLVRPALDVHLIQVLSREELEPDLAGDLRLVDSEERDGLDVSVTAGLVRAYRRNLAAYLSGIEDYARRRGLGYLRCSTGVSFEDLVLRHLREQGVLQ